MSKAKRLLCVILSACVMLSFFSCGNGDGDETTTSPRLTSINGDKITSTTTSDKSTISTSTSQSESETTVSTAPPANNTYYNPLTGLATTKELSCLRPVAIVINNTKSSRAQNGIGQADILYEAFVESTTRFLMITQNYSALSTVGAIRSVRAYHASIAAAHEAILIGAGATDEAIEKINKMNCDYINALNYEYKNSLYFWRDDARKTATSYEDALVSNGKAINLIIGQKDYETVSKREDNELFCFVGVNSEKNMSGGANATEISIPFTSVCTSNFTYDAKNKNYKFSQYDGKPYTDANTNKQVCFENLLILVTDITKIPGDADGQWDIKTVGSGSGYYCYGGKWVAINWSRKSEASEFVYTYPNGNPLDMARGKTYIAIIRESIEDVMTIS